MATDTTLVQGAYDANKYRGQAVDEAHRRIGDNLNDTVGKLAANKRAEKEALEIKAEEALARGVGDEDKEQVKSRVQLLQDEFIDPNTSEQRKQELQQEIVNLGANMQEVNEITGAFAESAMSGDDISGGATSEQTEFLNLILSDGKRVIENPDKPGEYGFDFNGNFISTTKADKMLGQTQKDVDSFEGLRDITTANSGLVDTQDESVGFDREKVMRDVKGVIKNAGNIRSLMYDSNFDDTSFIEDLVGGGLNIKYTDLGLEPPAGDEDGEFNPQDNLSEEDKQSVINAFVDKEELSTPLLEAYFVQHTENRWNQAYKQKHNKDWVAPVTNTEPQSNGEITDADKSNAVVATV